MQQLGVKFRRQHPVGNYILDFACIELKLAIELDGGQHADIKVNDNERTRWLESQGWQVIRFWNNEVLKNAEGVVTKIYAELIRIMGEIKPPF